MATSIPNFSTSSLENPIAAHQEASVGMATRQSSIEKPQFKQALSEWASSREVAPTEKRREAEALVLNAYETQTADLNLSGYNLTSVPECLGQLTQLERLSVDNNQLTTLPDGIGLLCNLEELSLNNNQLTTLPNRIAQLPKLSLLYLHRNPLKSLPISLFKSPVVRHNIAADVCYKGARTLEDGTREEGTFKYSTETKQLELLEGVVTKSDGKRERRIGGKYSKLRMGIVYETKTPLSRVAPPGPPTKLTVAEYEAARASTSTPQTAPLLVAEPNSTQIQDLPKYMQDGVEDALNQLRDMPLDQLKSFLSNDLGNFVVMPQLPDHLHNSEAHRNFFKD